MSVSLLICTMNNVDGVVNLIRNLESFFSEIILIDSSDLKNYKLLKRKIKSDKVKIVNLPPIGFVDPYLQIGMDLAKNEWIFVLADDEIPCAKLLRDLKTLTKEYKVYTIRRHTPGHKKDEYVIRLFPRKLVRAPGIIHWGEFISKTLPIRLSDDYYIIHNDTDLIRNTINLTKLKKYAIIESYQAGIKILLMVKNGDKFYRYNEKKLGCILFRFILKFKKIKILTPYVWFISVITYYFYFVLEHIKLKSKIGTFYYLTVLREIINNFGEKVNLWEKIDNSNLFDFYISFNDISKTVLSYKKTYENLIKIYKLKFKF